MGVFAVLEDEAGSPVPVTQIPSEFRFSDTNPVTGLPYAESRWRDLPEYAAEVIETRSGFCGGEWDILVQDREVAEFIDIDRVHSLTGWMSKLARRYRTAKPQGDQCPDCLGTCVMIDIDGSMTGMVGSGVLCSCAEPVQVRRPRTIYVQAGWGM